jgi:hypothetical protein
LKQVLFPLSVCRYGITKEIKATLSDADTVLSNEGGKSPQIWSTAAEYVAALNTKYQAKDPPALLFFLNPPYQSFILSTPLLNSRDRTYILILALTFYSRPAIVSFTIKNSSVGDPDPQDPHVLGHPDPFVRGTDPDPSLFS